MRLFTAINFAAENRGLLHELTLALRASARRGTFVPEQNLHLTLVFLGECTGSEVDAACAALDRLVFAPFELHVDSLGCFAGKGTQGKRRQGGGGGDTWWAGVAPNDELVQLQANLQEEMLAAGLKCERRAFRPHVTLGRQVLLPEGVLAPGLAATGIDICEQVTSIELMRSQQLDGRPVYDCVHSCAAIGG
jgi:2'-5' RNA ligase